MKKSILKSIICAVIAGLLCLLVPNGSYNGSRIAIYQQPFNILVFYIFYFVLQSDFHYEHSMFDVRCSTIFKSKLIRFRKMVVPSVIFIAVYLLSSFVISHFLSGDDEYFFNSFSLLSWLITMLLNITLLNIFSVNMDFAVKKNTIVALESLVVLGGLALCFSASEVVPYVCIWFYGVYPKPVIPSVLAVCVYSVWFGIVVLCSLFNSKDILRKE